MNVVLGLGIPLLGRWCCYLRRKITCNILQSPICWPLWPVPHFLVALDLAKPEPHLGMHPSYWAGTSFLLGRRTELRVERNIPWLQAPGHFIWESWAMSSFPPPPQRWDNHFLPASHQQWGLEDWSELLRWLGHWEKRALECFNVKMCKKEEKKKRALIVLKCGKNYPSTLTPVYQVNRYSTEIFLYTNGHCQNFVFCFIRI